MKLLKFLKNLTKSGIMKIEGASMSTKTLSEKDKEIIQELKEISERLDKGEPLKRSPAMRIGGTYQATSASPRPYEDNPEFYDKLIDGTI